MGNTFKKVSDKEGVLFKIEKDLKLNDLDRTKPSVMYLERHFKKLLDINNVDSNVIGFSGEITHLSQFLSYFLDQYHIDSQYLQIDSELEYPYLGEN
ncbi:hypothetical protein [Aquirufa nivalisilvae]